MPSTYTPIATQTLGSDTATITFSSIPSTYTDLILVAAANVTAGANTSAYMQFNTDTGTNYSDTVIYGTGSAAVSARDTSVSQIWFGQIHGSTYGFPPQIAHIMNYSNTTTNKTVISRGGSTAQLTMASVGLWRANSAINSIKLFAESSRLFSTGSTFTLYGIKAA